MTGKRIALTFISLLGTGVLLFALVWRMQGTLSIMVGITAALFIISAIKFLERALEDWYTEKKQRQKQDEDLFGASGAGQSWNAGAQSWTVSREEPVGQPFSPESNLPLKRRLLWCFGVFAALGFSAVLFGKKLPASFPEPVMGAGLAIGLWNSLMFAAARESFNPEKPSHDFAWMWGKNSTFRRNNILLGLLLLTVFTGCVLLMPPPPNAGPYIIGSFLALVGILVGNMLYVRRTLEKGIPQPPDDWTPGQKKMEKWVNVSVVLLWVLGYVVLSIFLPDYIEELYFALLFTAGGMLIGFVVHDFIKIRFPGFFSDEKRKVELLTRIYLSCIILTLCTATAANHQTAHQFVRKERYPVLDKSEGLKGKMYLWLEIGGKKKRFEPREVEWNSAHPGDTLSVLVGKGMLGFDVILRYGTPEQ